MLTIGRILVPCDFSESSRQAVMHAAALARWYDAGLTLLHAVPLWPTTSEFPPYVNPIGLDPEVRDRLTDELRTLAAPLRDLRTPPRYLVHEGDPTNAILASAAKERADLIVMGKHSRRDSDRWAMGSVTERLLRRADCPVLTIHADSGEPVPPGEAPFKRIVCGLDFAAPSSDALRHALALAEESDAELTLAHVIEWSFGNDAAMPPELSGQSFQDYVERGAEAELHKAIPPEARDWCRIAEVITAGRPAREILRLAAERKADLVVVGAHGASVLGAMLFGSTARQIVRDAACPVMTVRAGAGYPLAARTTQREAFRC